jgi:two-component sensor histidine kinase
MALIHEKLYRFGDLARIDFADYIRSLAGYLFHAYVVDSDDITLTLNVDKVLLSIDAVTPCALLIHELVSNSLKHAFPGGKGEISIDFHTEDQHHFLLCVRDNGVGCPKDFDLQSDASLGVQLITALVDQLDGTLEFDNANGVSFQIAFTLPEYRERGRRHEQCASARC